jgi:site-specific DNA-methyltransferase (adenine-specific)
MKPYYEHAGITIYHGDCREILPELEDFSLVLTDPPYGVGMEAFSDDFSMVKGLRLCKSNLMACFMSPRQVYRLCQVLDGCWNFERILWMEKSADISFPWRGWLMNSEAILIFSKPDAIWPKPERYSRDCYRVSPWGKQGHPNNKPPDVVQDIMQKIGGQTILDPFMGSGTTLRAAKDLGCRAVGIEIEEKYCEIAAKRLSQEVLEFEPQSNRG